MEYLYLGIIIGVVINKFIFPFFELLQERITYSVTVGATKSQMKAQQVVCDFNRKYPEYEGVAEKSPAIGFEYAPEELEYEDDFEDDDLGENNLNAKNLDTKIQNKIGFGERI